MATALAQPGRGFRAPQVMLAGTKERDRASCEQGIPPAVVDRKAWGGSSTDGARSACPRRRAGYASSRAPQRPAVGRRGPPSLASKKG